MSNTIRQNINIYENLVVFIWNEISVWSVILKV